MRHVHQGALLFDAGERLVEAQLGRDVLLEKEADDLPFPRLDLLRHDDERVPVGQFAGAQGAPYLVVVGHRYSSQTDLAGRPNDRLHRVLRVLGEGRVHVKVGVDPVGPGRAQRGLPRPAAERLLADAAHVQRTSSRRRPACHPVAGRRGDGLLVERLQPSRRPRPSSKGRRRAPAGAAPEAPGRLVPVPPVRRPPKRGLDCGRHRGEVVR